MRKHELKEETDEIDNKLIENQESKTETEFVLGAIENQRNDIINHIELIQQQYTPLIEKVHSNKQSLQEQVQQTKDKIKKAVTKSKKHLEECQLIEQLATQKLMNLEGIDSLLNEQRELVFKNHQQKEVKNELVKKKSMLKRLLLITVAGFLFGILISSLTVSVPTISIMIAFGSFGALIGLIIGGIVEALCNCFKSEDPAPAVANKKQEKPDPDESIEQSMTESCGCFPWFLDSFYQSTPEKQANKNDLREDIGEDTSIQFTS